MTYLVPAARLHPHLPEQLQLQGFRGDDGGDWAFVSASCFRNEKLRWAGGPSPEHTVYQSTYRTYVRHGDDLGAFFLSSYVGDAMTTFGQKLGLADTRNADFDVHIDRDPDGGYHRYRARIEADDGVTRCHVVATEPPRARHPFATAREHVRFITHRLHGYAYSAAGVPVDAQVEHAEMQAFEGRLLEARFPALERRELLDTDEQQSPFSVLVSPGVTFDLLTPVPLRAS